MSTAEAQTHHLTFDYPENFVVEDSAQTAGADLVLVHTPDAGFRPNLVVTSVESNAALSDASLAAMRAAHAQHVGAHIVAVDAWASKRADGQEYLARHILFTYPAEVDAVDGALIVVSKWIWATGVHHVHLTASASMSQWQVFSGVFDAIAANAQLAATDETLAEMAEPTLPLDAHAADRGEPLEDLRPIVAEWRKLRLTEAAAAPAFVTKKRASLGTDPVFQGPALFNITARRGLRTEQLVVFSAPHGATLMASAPLHEEPLASRDLVRVTGTGVERAPAAIAEWLGVQPAWIFADGSAHLSAAQIEEHVVAPEQSSSGSVTPWTQFILVHADGAIAFVLTPDNGYVQLVSSDSTSYTPHPLQSMNLFTELVRLCALHCESARSRASASRPRRDWSFGRRSGRTSR